jgi:hypothetical protein
MGAGGVMIVDRVRLRSGIWCAARSARSAITLACRHGDVRRLTHGIVCYTITAGALRNQPKFPGGLRSAKGVGFRGFKTVSTVVPGASRVVHGPQRYRARGELSGRSAGSEKPLRAYGRANTRCATRSRPSLPETARRPVSRRRRASSDIETRGGEPSVTFGRYKVTALSAAAAWASVYLCSRPVLTGSSRSS